jgi:uncharacterized protein YndB with AHSA1/START domain
MSKKSKGSSAKKSKASKSKSAKKPAKKSASKKSVAKKPIKKTTSKPKHSSSAGKKAAKPVKKVVAKKPVKKIIAKVKPVKPLKVKAEKPVAKIEVKKIKEYKNAPVSKKDLEPIPEYKPVIKATVKIESSSKEGFPTALKSTSASSFITNPSKKTESYSIKPEKEPAGKFELEFVIRSSATILYEFLVTPSGLSEWFCDDVNIRNGIYTFVWDGQLQQARLLKTIEEQLVRYQWVDKTDGSYFEFRIQRDDLTNDISLMIIDFANEKGEQESAKLLWTSQVDKLLHILGSSF